MTIDWTTTPLGRFHFIQSVTKAVATAVVAILVAGALSNRVEAALTVVGGELVGATNVSVNGSFFDVTFVEGNCFSLFDNCNEASDFDFQTQADAVAAAQALLDQVFIDGPAGQFDTDPELTFSCVNTFACTAVIPFDSQGFQNFSFAAAVNHLNPPLIPTLVDAALAPLTNFVAVSSTSFGGGQVNHVFAKFSAAQGPGPGNVPAGGAVWLMLMGVGYLIHKRYQTRA